MDLVVTKDDFDIIFGKDISEKAPVLNREIAKRKKEAIQKEILEIQSKIDTDSREINSLSSKIEEEYEKQ